MNEDYEHLLQQAAAPMVLPVQTPVSAEQTNREMVAAVNDEMQALVARQLAIVRVLPGVDHAWVDDADTLFRLGFMALGRALKQAAVVTKQESVH